MSLVERGEVDEPTDCCEVLRSEGIEVDEAALELAALIDERGDVTLTLGTVDVDIEWRERRWPLVVV